MSVAWLALRIIAFPLMLAFMLFVLCLVAVAGMAVWMASGKDIDFNGHMPGWPR